MSTSVKGAGAYARNRASLIADPFKRELATENYVAGRELLAQFEQGVKLCLDQIPDIRLVERNQLLNLCRRAYRLARRASGELLVLECARAAADWVRRGCDRGRVTTAVSESLRLCAKKLEGESLSQFESMLEDCLKGGIVPDIEQDVAAVESPKQRRRFVRLESSDLAERCREFFGSFLDDRELAEGAAAELVASLTGEKPGAGPGTEPAAVKPAVRRGGAKRSRTEAGLNLAELEKPDAGLQYARNRAKAMLKQALAAHEPLVRRCVALRLSRLASYEELAEELDLSVEDVRYILTSLRAWVRRYTTFFDRDWYWQDGVRRFSVEPGTRAQG